MRYGCDFLISEIREFLKYESSMRVEDIYWVCISVMVGGYWNDG